MDIFRTKTFSLPINLSSEIGATFEKPLIFYLTHKDDRRSFFITFVILDFAKKELKYVVSYLPENVAQIENHPQSKLFRVMNAHSAPHYTIETKKDESFLTFFEFVPYFFKVDYQKNSLSVYTDEDLEKNPDTLAIDFSPTNYTDQEDSRYFYFYSLLMDKNNVRQRTLVLHKASLDLSEIGTIHTEDAPKFLGSPHTIRRIGHYLVNSNFLHCQFKNLKSGTVFEDQHAYALFVYDSLYKEYCQKNNLSYADIFFQNKNFFSEIEATVKSDSKFSAFCLAKGKSFWEICKRNPIYTFTPLPGSIMLIDLETKQEKTFETTFCAPAHFEIDQKTGDIFVSSHNFLSFGQRYFWGPAAIDRFHLENGELIKLSTFSHPTGYRFTSHKIFSWKDRTYICTFGQPNRLFFIDAETMTLEFYEDIGEDFLSNQANIAHYLNYAELEPFVITTLEVSADGQFIFFLSHDYIYFYSFPKRKIVQKIKYNEGTSPDGEIALANFRSLTIHTNYL